MWLFYHTPDLQCAVPSHIGHSVCALSPAPHSQHVQSPCPYLPVLELITLPGAPMTCSCCPIASRPRIKSSYALCACGLPTQECHSTWSTAGQMYTPRCLTFQWPHRGAEGDAHGHSMGPVTGHCSYSQQGMSYIWQAPPLGIGHLPSLKHIAHIGNRFAPKVYLGPYKSAFSVTLYHQQMPKKVASFRELHPCTPVHGISCGCRDRT